MKVLIVKLSSIGDVIHTLPALAALKEGYKKKDSDFEIDWIVEEAASGLLIGNPIIDNVIVVKRRGWSRSFRENWKRAKELRTRRYDMVIDFQGLAKSAIWVWLSRGKRRVGFARGRELSSLPLNDKLPPYDPEKHAVERYLDLALHAGGKIDGGIFFPIHITDEEAASAKRVVEKSIKTADKSFFVIAARARWKTKLWSDENFIEFARIVTKKYSLHALLIGSADDKEGLEAMAGAIGENATNIAGQTNLKELAALLGLARFAITVDTGPMHLAAAMGTRTVALFGPTAPWRTGPYGREHIVIRKGLECSPCYKRECADPVCLTEIEVGEVTEALDRLLLSTAKSGCRG